MPPETMPHILTHAAGLFLDFCAVGGGLLVVGLCLLTLAGATLYALGGPRRGRGE